MQAVACLWATQVSRPFVEELLSIPGLVQPAAVLWSLVVAASVELPARPGHVQQEADQE